MHGWSQVSSAATTAPLVLEASDTSTGIAEMMFSNDSGFTTNSGWLPFKLNYNNWAVDTTTYVKIRDFAGNESVVHSDNINIGSHTIIDPGIL